MQLACGKRNVYRILVGKPKKKKKDLYVGGRIPLK
jgi:hypothetical protein